MKKVYDFVCIKTKQESRLHLMEDDPYVFDGIKTLPLSSARKQWSENHVKCIEEKIKICFLERVQLLIFYER